MGMGMYFPNLTQSVCGQQKVIIPSGPFQRTPRSMALSTLYNDFDPSIVLCIILTDLKKPFLKSSYPSEAGSSTSNRRFKTINLNLNPNTISSTV